MIIREFYIENYKSFKKLVFDPKDACREATMIFGYNNSGKSNLLKFLHLIFMKKYGGATYKIEEDGTDKIVSRFKEGVENFWTGQIVDSPYLFTDHNTSTDIKFKVKFEENIKAFQDIGSYQELLNEKDNKFEITGRIVYQDFDVSNIYLDEAMLNGKIILKRDIQGNEKWFPDIKKFEDNKEGFEKILSVFNNSVLLIDKDRYFVNLPIESNKEKNQELTPSNFKKWLFDLSLDPQKYSQFEELIGFLNEFEISTNDEKGKPIPFLVLNNKYFPIDTSEIGFAKFGDKINFMLIHNKTRLPIESFGSGIQQLLYILSKIFFTNAKVLLIEEIELNHSPRYQESLLKFLNKLIDSGKINQLFFTSHSFYFRRCTDIIKRFFDVRLNADGYSEMVNVRSAVSKDDYLDSI